MLSALRVRLCAASVAVALVITAQSPRLEAHILPDTVTLSQRTASADLVVLARITGSNPIINSKNSINTQPLQPLVEADIEETLRGEAPPKRLRFSPHRHTGDAYKNGEELILFLKKKDSPNAGGEHQEHQWISIDDFADRISLDPSNKSAFISAVRAYAKALASAGQDRKEAFRTTTLGLLSADQPRLAAFALRDLLSAQDALAILPEDLPKLEQLIENKKHSIALRTALLSELSRRQLIQSDTAWLNLLNNTSAPDLATVTKSLPKPLSAALAAELERLLVAPSPEAIKAAALALGSPANESALAPLLTALGASDQPSVRLALVEAIARIGSPSAQQKLQEIARQHPDADLRRSAQTELNLIQIRTKNNASNTAGALPSISADPPAPPSEQIQQQSRSIRLSFILGAAFIALIALAAAAYAFYWRRPKRGAAPPPE